jgi:hypothetical protein
MTLYQYSIMSFNDHLNYANLLLSLFNKYIQMDVSRGVLDNLMGRDRNISKNSLHTRDHYSNADVTVSFTIGLQSLFGLFLF